MQCFPELSIELSLSEISHVHREDNGSVDDVSCPIPPERSQETLP